MLTGINFTRANDTDQFTRHIKKYLSNSIYSINKPELDWDGDIKVFVKQYKRQEAQRFRAAQEFYRHVKALRIIDSKKYNYEYILQLMKETGISSETERLRFLDGIFTPKQLTDDSGWETRKKFKNTDSEIEAGLKEIERFYNYFNQSISLEPTENYEKENIKSMYKDDTYDLNPFSTSGPAGGFLQKRAAGGVISTENPVPQVPNNPAERINKMTGEPYSDTAGFEDPLKRLGFTGGGQVDPLARLGFSGKRTGKVLGGLRRSKVNALNIS